MFPLRLPLAPNSNAWLGSWGCSSQTPSLNAVILHILNGQLMAVLMDNDPASSNNVSGLIGLQIEGVPCKVSFRNLWLRKIE